MLGGPIGRTLFEKGIPMRRLPLACAVFLALFLALGGTAIAAKQYVLKHPKHEHCKAHYVKKTKTVKRHREILCVYVVPPPADPAPVVPAPVTPAPVVAAPTPAPVVPTPPAPEEPAKPVGPFTTTTTLKVSSPEECKIESIGGVGSVNSCFYTVSASVEGNKEVLTSPSPTFIFTNTGNNEHAGTVSETHSFRLDVSVERIESLVETSVSIPHVGVIETASGEAAWSIVATYAGSSNYSSSQSVSKKVS